MVTRRWRQYNWHRMRKLTAIGALAATIGCSALSPQESHLLWTTTTVGLPQSASDDLRCQDTDLYVQPGYNPCMARIKPSQPVVLFLHGCSGPNPHYVKAFRDAGYVVFAPNSLVNGRRASCPTNLGIVAARIEEAGLVLDEIRKLPWVDHSRLVLAGFSEGGIATALYPHDGLRAKIIMGWTCRSDYAPWVGVRGSAATLALVGSADHFHTAVNHGDCGMEFRGLPTSSRSIVHVGYGHDVLSGDPAVVNRSKKAIGEFLAEVLR